MTAKLGECTLTRWYDPAGDYVTVDRADPRVWISARLLQLLQEIPKDSMEANFSSLVGDVLTINGRNCRVVYRIDWATQTTDGLCYLAEWPD